jgi:hypothetical protein
MLPIPGCPFNSVAMFMSRHCSLPARGDNSLVTGATFFIVLPGTSNKGQLRKPPARTMYEAAGSCRSTPFCVEVIEDQGTSRGIVNYLMHD